MSRDRKEVKYMSASELKSKLYAHFDKSGSFDHLRAQLRGQLVTELFKVATPSEESQNLHPEVKEFDQSLLPLQVSNWLVYDHLLRQGYQYALSTFVSEANLPYPEKLLTACDILGLFGFDSNSPEYQYVSTIYTANNDHGFLHSLLLSIIKSLFEIPERNTKLKFSELNQPKSSVHEREESSRKFLSKSFMNNMKSREAESSSYTDALKFHMPTRNSEFVFFQPDKSADMDLLHQLQLVKQENEREVQKLRHKLLEEIDKLHLQEHKMYLEMEHEKNEMKNMRSRLHSELEKVKEKELLLEMELENKLQEKIRESKEYYSSQWQLKDKEFESLQKRLLEKEQRLTDKEIELAALRENSNVLNKELNELQHMYEILENKYSILLDENTGLRKKFENISDYSNIKEELHEKSKMTLDLRKEITEIELEKQKLKEHVKNLEHQLRAKEPQLFETEKSLHLIKETLQTQESIWNRERRQLEQELHISKKLHKDVIQRLEDQKEDIQDLHRTIHILHYQLTNNSAGNSKPDSHEHFTSSSLPLGMNQMGRQADLRKSTFSRDLSRRYREQSLNFISETKKRIQKLQQEADVVQDKYSFLFSALKENNIFETDSTVLKNVSASRNDIVNYELSNISNSFPKNYFDDLVKRKMASNPKNVLPVFHGTQFAKDPRTYASNNAFNSLRIQDRSSSSNIPNAMLHNDYAGSSKELDGINLKSNLSKPSTPDQHIYFTEIYGQNVSSEKDDLKNRADNNNKIALPDVPSSKISADLNSNCVNVPTPSDFRNNHTDEQTSSGNNLCTEVILSEELEKQSSENPSPYKKSIETEIKIPYTMTTSLTDQGNGAKSIKNFSYLSEEILENSEESSAKFNQEKKTFKEFPNTGTDTNKSAQVIDLDAAWKQKSFALSFTPFMRKDDAIISTLKESQDIVNSLSTNKNVSDNLQLDVIEDSDSCHVKNNSNPEISRDVNTVHVRDKTETLNMSLSQNEVTFHQDIITPKHNAEKKEIEVILLEQKLEANQDIQTHTSAEQSDQKLKNVDSLSELSDVHISCGSEQDQQKEDSDFW